MNEIYLKLKKGVKFFSLLAIGMNAQAQTTTLTFTHTGAQQTFTIPSCVGSMTILAKGAAGSVGGSSGSAGANGGSVYGIITATPGAVMYINVGGQGSVNAG